MQAVIEIHAGDFVCALFQAIILPEVEEIDDFDIECLADSVECCAVPAAFEQRIALAVAVSALLLDENDAHTLCHCALCHIGDDFLVLRFGGIILGVCIVDTDRDDVDVAGLTVLLNDGELSGIHKAPCPLAGSCHIHDLPFGLVDEIREHLRPAGL